MSREELFEKVMIEALYVGQVGADYPNLAGKATFSTEILAAR
jgi:hypothetical protein